MSEISKAIEALIDDAVAAGGTNRDTDLINDMIHTVLDLNRNGADRGDLKLINTSLKEMRDAFAVFGNYRNARKVCVFGSARIGPDTPNYTLASDFASHMARVRGWMVVTGAGPGLMEAANLGAGQEHSLGVNIRLPFEDAANPYIHPDRLVDFNYFFTRKLMFVKESDAFALFPGGFGTQDETFELLTLTQTGKSSIHPIVLIEAPGTGYWQPWRDFVETTLIDQGMISPRDLNLYTYTTDVETAADVICRFYTNYHSQRFVGDLLILRLLRPLQPAHLERLNDEFGDVLASGRIESVGPARPEVADDDNVGLPCIAFHFDRRSLGRLRSMVDLINELSPGESSP